MAHIRVAWQLEFTHPAVLGNAPSEEICPAYSLSGNNHVGIAGGRLHVGGRRAHAQRSVPQGIQTEAVVKTSRAAHRRGRRTSQLRSDVLNRMTDNVIYVHPRRAVTPQRVRQGPAPRLRVGTDSIFAGVFACYL